MSKSIIGTWLRQSALVCLFAGPYEIDPCDHPYAKATTPDEIIAAGFIESFAKDFNDWVVVDKPNVSARAFLGAPDNEYLRERYEREKKAVDAWEGKYTLLLPNHRSTVNRALVNEKKKWRLVYCRQLDCYGDYVLHTIFYVNNVLIPDEVGRKILKSFTTLKEKYEKAAQEAAAAKKRMEEEEKKWNLAEDMLGMKRNEFGALVPKYQITES